MCRIPILALVVTLAGCAHDPQDGCRASFRQGSKFNIAGIEIPIGATTPFKIGQATYEVTQAKELEKFAQEMEQVRLTQCIALNPKVLELLPPTDRAAIVSRGQTAFAFLFNWAKKLQDAPDAQAGLKAAKEAIDQANKVLQPTPTPGASFGDAMPTAQLALRTATSAAERADAAKAGVNDLSARVASLSEVTAPSRIIVSGFDVSAVGLTTEQRGALLAAFAKALREAPSHRIVMVQVLGYADASGFRDRNVLLGLRRAQVVAEFLEQQRFDRPFTLAVGSGGVALPPNEARRVEVLIA